MTPTSQDAGPRKQRIRYLRFYVWFYVWKWTMPVPWLHRRTIRPVNHARCDYIDAIWEGR